MSQWRDIETAPKDGTDVLLCWSDGIAVPMFRVGHHLGGGRRWQDTHQWLHNVTHWPTHWMPLPEPPALSPSPLADQPKEQPKP